MGSAALAELLTDFGDRPRGGAEQPARIPASVRQQPDPVPDIKAIVAEAVAQAELALAARLDAEHQAALQAALESHAAELDEVRGRLGAETGAKLAAALVDLENRTIQATTSVTARILAQFVSDDIAERAVAELAHTIKDAIGDADTMRIRIRGPQSLFVPLTMAMGEQARHLELVETSALDITASVDETLFETRISEWSVALAEVLA